MSGSDTYLKIDTRYTVLYTFLFKMGQKPNIFISKRYFLSFDSEIPAKKMLFSAIVNRKGAKFILLSVKLVPFIVVLRVCGRTSRKFLDLVLGCKMKFQHFTVVTSFLQILLVLRVMFRVHVYWSGSDTYPVFRTRFSPTNKADLFSPRQVFASTSN